MNNYKIMDDYVIIYLRTRKDKIFECYIDLEDFDLVKDKYWYPSYAKDVNGYYAKHTEYLGLYNGKPKYKMHYMHRIIINAPKGKRVDHKDHNTLDNRKSNLRFKNCSDNGKNRKSKNKNNKSGYRNVSWNKKAGQWAVQLIVNGKNTLLKMFNDVHEAGEYAKIKREEIYGEVAGND